MLNALSVIVDFMEPARWLSPFYYYNGATPLVNGLSPAHVAVLLAIVLVCVAVAYFGFQRRDVY
jgi:ABC-2 type transport system permease protein